jgi:membrane protease YdiL (CAAX protease family)
MVFRVRIQGLTTEGTLRLRSLRRAQGRQGRQGKPARETFDRETIVWIGTYAEVWMSDDAMSESGKHGQFLPRPDNDRFASELRGFGPVGILAILLILVGNGIFMPYIPAGALLVLAWAWRSGTPWSEIGYARPASWMGSVAGGIAFGCAFKIAMKALVMPLLGADPINHAYHFLAGNRAAIPLYIFAFTIGAGFGEETVFRGYLFERFGKLLGGSAVARTAIVFITSLWFAALHYSDQGLAGAEQALITGLTFGTIFMLTGRIWMVMTAHAAFDLTAYAIIYWGLETRAAHLIFK